MKALFVIVIAAILIFLFLAAKKKKDENQPVKEKIPENAMAKDITNAASKEKTEGQERKPPLNEKISSAASRTSECKGQNTSDPQHELEPDYPRYKER